MADPFQDFTEMPKQMLDMFSNKFEEAKAEREKTRDLSERQVLESIASNLDLLDQATQKPKKTSK